MDSQEPTTFGGGRFEVVARLGEGGMGVVYSAIDRDSGDTLAIKTLPRLTPRGVHRLKQEFRSIAKLRHRNLVQLHELFVESQQCFFTMELVEGEDFLSYIQAAERQHAQNPPNQATRTMEQSDIVATLSGQVVMATGSGERTGAAPRPSAVPAAFRRDATSHLLPVFQQLVHGVQYLHEQGKLHCDLKPSNIMVTREGRVVVLDFGLATERADVTMPAPDARSYIMGTPAYMSPEQLKGIPLGPASDWYMLGSVMYEALVGAAPFEGDINWVIRAKQTQSPTPPNVLLPSIPSHLSSLTMALLKSDPAERPTTELIFEALEMRPPQEQSPLDKIAAQDELFVGREEELSALAACADVSSGPHVALISGMSGLGKSSLAHQFLRKQAHERDAICLSSRCYEQEALAYKAIDGIMDGLLRHLDTEDRAIAHTLLPEGIGSLARLFPTLLRRPLVARMAKEGTPVADPQSVRNEAVRATKAWIGALTETRPVILFIDDLQWADADSEWFLRDLLTGEDAPRVLLVASYRSEAVGSAPFLNSFLPFVEAQPRLAATTIEVGALTTEAIRLLLHEAEASRGDQLHLDAVSVQSITEQSQGNPYLLRELLRYVWQSPNHAADGVDLSVAIERRVRALDPTARRLLDTLSVAGQRVSQAALIDAAGTTQNVDAALLTLRNEHLVRAMGLRRADWIETYHDRIREVAHHALTPQLRRVIHAKLARALERDGAEEDVLGQHYAGAGEYERASEYYAQAGEKAVRTVAFEHAARLFRRAAELRDDLPTKLRLIERQAASLAHAGRRREAGDAYLEVADRHTLATEISRVSRAAAAEYLLAGNLEDGTAILEEAMTTFDLAWPQSSAAALAIALPLLNQLTLRGHRIKLRPPEAIGPSVLERTDLCWSVALGLTEIDLRSMPFAMWHALFALDAGEPTRIVRGLALVVENVSLALGNHPYLRPTLDVLDDLHDTEDPRHIGWLHFAYGAYHCTAEPDLVRATQHLEQACAAFGTVPDGASRELGLARAYAAHLSTHLGAFNPMREKLEAWMADAERRDDLFAQTWMLLTSHKVWLAAGNPDQADKVLQSARAAWPNSTEGTFNALGLLYAMDVARFRGGDAALKVVRTHENEFLTSIEALAPFFRGYFYWQKTAACLEAALQTHGAERSELMAEAKKALVELETCQARWAPWRAIGLMMRGSLEAQEGAHRAALETLSEAETALARIGYAGYAPTVRLRRLELASRAGMPASPEEVEQTRTHLTDLGISAIDRWSRGMLPF